MRKYRLSIAVVYLFSHTVVGAEPTYRSVTIAGVPHVRQKPDFCGEACVEMWLRKLGHGTTQDQVFSLSGVDPHLGRGMVTRELSATLKRIGFVVGDTWHRMVPSRVDKEGAAQWQALHADLTRGIPSIVCMYYSDAPKTTQHFRLILGYDAKTDEVIYNEPAEDKGAYRRMKRALFLKIWPLRGSGSSWTLIRMRLHKGEEEDLALGKPGTGYTSADFCQWVRKEKKRTPRGFTTVIQPPFVVIGDESPARVKHRATRTIKWCSDHLKKLYFTREPASIYTVWLFKGKTSYEKHTKLLFNSTPDTPFGYCSDEEKALVMNIGTGGGTLCHEIVHAYMGSNFPKCPSWFNEGMGSLYEQCGEREGRLVGFTNWRLAGLQKAIRSKAVPSFKDLCNTSTHQFYSMDKGTNYSQARYLCYYLQEKGLLVKYYNAFRRGVKDDPTGYSILKAILDKDDMDEFKDDWERWVLTLRYQR